MRSNTKTLASAIANLHCLETRKSKVGPQFRDELDVVKGVRNVNTSNLNRLFVVHLNACKR